MRGAFLLGFVLALPPLAALGHDLYLAYGQGSELDLSKPFQFSDVGWLWQTYAAETMRSARAGFDPVTWSTWIRPLLEQSAVFLSSIPLLIFTAYCLAEKLVKSGTLFLAQRGVGGPRKRGDYAFGKQEDPKKTKLKYKRK